MERLCRIYESEHHECLPRNDTVIFSRSDGSSSCSRGWMSAGTSWLLFILGKVFTIQKKLWSSSAYVFAAAEQKRRTSGKAANVRLGKWRRIERVSESLTVESSVTVRLLAPWPLAVSITLYLSLTLSGDQHHHHHQQLWRALRVLTWASH